MSRNITSFLNEKITVARNFSGYMPYYGPSVKKNDFLLLWHMHRDQYILTLHLFPFQLSLSDQLLGLSSLNFDIRGNLLTLFFYQTKTLLWINSMKFLSWFQIDVSEDCLLFEYKNAIGICSEEINRQLLSRLLRPRQTDKAKKSFETYYTLHPREY